MTQAQRVRQRPLETLVLNADYQPLSTWPPSIVPLKKALKKLVNERVDVVETWDVVINAGKRAFSAPKVVVCRHYAPVFSNPKFCRRSVYLRDRYRCQYCGQKFEEKDLTFDHLIPRSKGGKTEWTNVLTACGPCNAIKRNQDANFSGRKGHRAADGRLRPLKMPRQPTTAELLRNGLELLPAEIREDFGSWLYWSAPLEP